ncbi:MAG: hypothetical protein H3Z52_15620 [archaeon]|nr:hypothetical protein [archaeon]MCP8322346.1 hypothetical protein [archaeon]
MSEVAEIEIKPWSKLTVHEVLEVDFQTLVRSQALGQPAGGQAPPLNWVNGIIFRSSPFPPSGPVVKEMLEGRLHWLAMEFALCPEYKPAIQVGDLRVTVPLINVSHNKIFVKMAEQLKAMLQDKEALS